MRWAALSTAAVLAMLGGLTAPAVSADSTNTSFVLTGGSLGISVPASASLGSRTTGAGVLSANLGSITVTDDRGSLVAVWTTTVSSTDFTTGGGGANETVAKTNVAYASGTATATSGTGAFVPGTVASLLLPGVAGAWAGGAGNNSVTWNPTIAVTLTGTEVAGTYTGTITHSVA